jgi:hypothetical protein
MLDVRVPALQHQAMLVLLVPAVIVAHKAPLVHKVLLAKQELVVYHLYCAYTHTFIE